MTKEAERNYLRLVGKAGQDHAKYKPFSNHDCGLTLCSIGVVITLMPPAPARVLDLGCGTGWTSIFLAKHGYEVVGQDISQDMIDLAIESKQENGVGDNLAFRVGDFESLAAHQDFDCVLFFDSLHHADNEADAILFAASSLKPGGIMITHEPGEGHSTAPHSLEAMELYGVNEKDMPPHLIISLAQRSGFGPCRIYPMQHELVGEYYSKAPSRLWTKRGIKRAIRLVRMAFKPSNRTGAIVVARKV